MVRRLLLLGVGSCTPGRNAPVGLFVTLAQQPRPLRSGFLPIDKVGRVAATMRGGILIHGSSQPGAIRGSFFGMFLMATLTVTVLYI